MSAMLVNHECEDHRYGDHCEICHYQFPPVLVLANGEPHATEEEILKAWTKGDLTLDIALNELRKVRP